MVVVLVDGMTVPFNAMYMDTVWFVPLTTVILIIALIMCLAVLPVCVMRPVVSPVYPASSPTINVPATFTGVAVAAMTVFCGVAMHMYVGVLSNTFLSNGDVVIRRSK